MKSNKRDDRHPSKDIAGGKSYRDIAKEIPSPRDVWREVELLEGWSESGQNKSPVKEDECEAESNKK
jgi:hypothetical protein